MIHAIQTLADLTEHAEMVFAHIRNVSSTTIARETDHVSTGNAQTLVSTLVVLTRSVPALDIRLFARVPLDTRDHRLFAVNV